MNGSLIPEIQFVTLTCSLWLTHRGDTMRQGLWKDGGAENPDKAAPLSLQQGVFESSPEEGQRGEFWEAELRVNSICRKTTTKTAAATNALPNQVALLKCKASLLQLLTKKKTNPVIKSKIHYMHHYATSITCLNSSKGFTASYN